MQTFKGSALAKNIENKNMENHLKWFHGVLTEKLVSFFLFSTVSE